VLAVLENVKRTRTKRVVQTGHHAAVAGRYGSEFRLALHHLIRRCPTWPFGLPLNFATARPGVSVFSKPNAITDGLAAILHQIKEMLVGIDNDRARRFVRLITDFLP